MKLNERVTGKILLVDKKGRGIMEKNGKEIASFFTVPGDEARLTLTKRQKGLLHGKIDEIISPSPHRVAPRCPYVGKCGGCPWQMIDYAKQTELKRELADTAFKKARLPVSVPKVETSGKIFYHRNRMDYVFGKNGELGLKEPERWWSVLDLGVCFMLSEGAVLTMEEVRKWAKDFNLQPWNNREYKGLLRYLIIREGKFTAERMAVLLTSAENFPEDAREALAERLKDKTTSLYWGINPDIMDVSFAKEVRILAGKRYLTEKINNFSFEIHPNSFFQTNSLMAGRLMDTVRELAELSGTERVLDLYCGVGFFGIGLAGEAREVIGIEIDADAIALANANAEANKVKNATFISGTAEDLLSKMPRPDVIVLDPPRSGLHPRVIKTMLAVLPQRIVYVSCNYASLCNELPEFLKEYEFKEVRALDMFPHTPHVEIVVSLTRKNLL